LVASIETDRRHGNLSSAIRLYVLDHYRARTGDEAIGPPPTPDGHQAASMLRAD
jgi:predicted DNA-binding ribbon-helix-helix protein